ncbi:hypothetical protein Ngar_c04730 [Candidatus Nitrososphaera gargensis Ga9.2]|uniref:Uncharacterized protein n=1 Tax=Nitrososphaera gargensis (strain Ga9.2) TaxID=1237085 RepID=K0IHT2_NITGG|nr:hypothetical protein [Candidatus Nitrososphaera gargensis]AFU57417.1 hypothetical protein Ngar_c04730 [Candidatus Nitrososphaera gargensis Ga9.2]
MYANALLNAFTIIAFFLLVNQPGKHIYAQENVNETGTSIPSNQNLPNTEASVASMQVQWIQLSLQFVIGGLVAGFALYFANRLLDHYRRPILRIAKDKSPVLRAFHSEVYSVSSPLLGAIPSIKTKYLVEYVANRIIVRNDGRNAAENCKAVLRIDGNEEKVAWISPTSGHTMTINANSVEYVDLCAILKGDQAQIVNDIRTEVSKLPTSGTNSYTKQTEVYEDSIKARTEVKKHYQSPDALPRVIAPTEDGWQQPPHRNRILAPTKAQIVITAKNAEPCVVDIEILAQPVDGRAIKFI